MINDDSKGSSSLLDGVISSDDAKSTNFVQNLAAQIEEERSKIKGLMVSGLSSPETVERVKNLETLITIYMRLTAEKATKTNSEK